MFRRSLFGRSLMSRGLGERPQQPALAPLGPGAGAGEEQTGDPVEFSDGIEANWSDNKRVEFS